LASIDGDGAQGAEAHNRVTQRLAHRPRPVGEDKVRRRLRAIAREHPRWGWKTAHVILRREGHTINKKRTRRLWRGRAAAGALQAQTDPTVGRRAAAASRATQPGLGHRFPVRRDRRPPSDQVVEHRRRAHQRSAGHARRPQLHADDVVTVIETLVAERGAPEHLRMDNGPELIAWTLRDWCRLHGTPTSYIEPGSPWENPFVESFNGRVRDELLNIEEFGSIIEAQVITEGWRVEYNTYRPHSSLGGKTTAEYAERWTINQPALP
jgi:putative transposase